MTDCLVKSTSEKENCIVQVCTIFVHIQFSIGAGGFD